MILWEEGCELLTAETTERLHKGGKLNLSFFQKVFEIFQNQRIPSDWKVLENHTTLCLNSVDKLGAL